MDGALRIEADAEPRTAARRVQGRRRSGLVDGNPHQVVNQLIAVAMTWAIAAIGSLVLLKIVDVVAGLRVTEDDEYSGLDLSQHGESGYNFEDVFPGTVIDESPSGFPVKPVASVSGAPAGAH